MNIGAFDRDSASTCSYQKTLYESTSPLLYNLYGGYGENCARPLGVDGKFWMKYDLVDVESELRNQTRPFSKCDQFQYSPNCKRSGLCLSTFDPLAPRPIAPEIVPVVYNNIPRMTSPGYVLPNPNFCGHKY